MAESIANRVCRILAGSAHALLDKAENLAPDAVMAQSVREIERVIAEVRIDLGKAEAARHLAISQMARLNTEREKLAEHSETAVAQGRDDLAGAAIGRQADIEDLLPILQKSLEEQSEHGKELEIYIVALLARKRELEQTLGEYQTALTGNAPARQAASDRQARVAAAESAFDRVLAGQTGASGMGMAADAGRLKELADLRRSHRIAERLAAIKASHGPESH